MSFLGFGHGNESVPCLRVELRQMDGELAKCDRPESINEVVDREPTQPIDELSF